MQQGPSFFIHSIYLATEGEGTFIGTPQIFIRFQGCSVGCKNCDSKTTWKIQPKYQKEFTDIWQKISSYSHLGERPIKRVSITGGDPLHPQNREAAIFLAKKLKEDNYFVNVEAAGTEICPTLFNLVDFISFDIKTPSTGVSFDESLLYEMINKYPNKFQVKSVIQHEEDFRFVKKIYQNVEKEFQKIPFGWSLTPCYNTGEPYPQERFQKIVKLNELAGGLFRVIPQQHKWIWGNNLTDV